MSLPAQESAKILTLCQQSGIITPLTRCQKQKVRNGIWKTMAAQILPRWQDLGGHEVYLIITGHDGKAGLKLVDEELKNLRRSGE